ncbi:PREDICTED: putative pentatricopeptide repeat-containing protein At3g01580 [Nelumbo nucifera]|uniref:Pentatricopeptide repeat-containing protein At3g01580 n=2 Tax=Nelumbo nucifera TaxID=4432 RepID=A0A1U8B4N1_NELNU|nr:PREDICTED: putative pentatricopeptide repeat-containing protein At3g01580 [Nelumbo nucifera]DAD38495.1 TPA_asm: hypothetical protein HUJ06_009136 [Nelumbo nucifera]
MHHKPRAPHIPLSLLKTSSSPSLANLPHEFAYQSTQTIYSNHYLQHSVLPSLNPTNYQTKPSHISSKPGHFFNNLFTHLRSPTTLSEVKEIHSVLVVNGFFHPSSSDMLFGPQLVKIYVGFGNLHEALLVFGQLPQKNNFAWNSILRGFVEAGQFSEALDFYHLMLREGLLPDNFTYPLVLKACSSLSDLEEGRRIRSLIKFHESHHRKETNIFVQCAMIDMFAKCGSLNEARFIFDEMPSKDLVSWSAMICGAVQNGEWFEALCLFRRMRSEGLRPDSVIVATILPACGKLGFELLGMGLQSCAIRSGFENDLFVSNAMIDMYCKCGDTHVARRVFYRMVFKDVVSWSTLIAGHSQNCEYYECLQLYVKMNALGVGTNAVTVASVLPAFATLKMLKQGKEMHNYLLRHGFESDVFVGSALIDMYANCGSMRDAESLFQIMSGTDITIWNSMIVGHALNGDVDSAFGILRRIQQSKHRPNSITLVSIIPLCTEMGTIRQGKEIHGCAIRNCLGSVVCVGNSLINMYCKCGYLELGVKVFDQMVEKDVVTYNTIIAAHGIHGYGERAFSFFDKMKEERIGPDKLTFIALLSACSHAGLLEWGWFFYNSMINEYGILPDMEHHSCMVDLLGRSGYLDEAWEFIRRMPVEPDISVLGSLLGACRVYNRLDLAEIVARITFEKNPEDPGYYILLSNIYASSGRWADASRIRAMIKEKGLTKKPGNSWIHVGYSAHMFCARNWMHPEFTKIQETLESLFLVMRDEGYVPDDDGLVLVDGRIP